MNLLTAVGLLETHISQCSLHNLPNSSHVTGFGVWEVEETGIVLLCRNVFRYQLQCRSQPPSLSYHSSQK